MVPRRAWAFWPLRTRRSCRCEVQGPVPGRASSRPTLCGAPLDGPRCWPHSPTRGATARMRIQPEDVAVSPDPGDEGLRGGTRRLGRGGPRRAPRVLAALGRGGDLDLVGAEHLRLERTGCRRRAGRRPMRSCSARPARAWTWDLTGWPGRCSSSPGRRTHTGGAGPGRGPDRVADPGRDVHCRGSGVQRQAGAAKPGAELPRAQERRQPTRPPTAPPPHGTRTNRRSCTATARRPRRVTPQRPCGPTGPASITAQVRPLRKPADQGFQAPGRNCQAPTRTRTG